MFRLKLIKYLEQPAIRLITTIFFSFALVIGATNVARSAELNSGWEKILLHLIQLFGKVVLILR